MRRSREFGYPPRGRMAYRGGSVHEEPDVPEILIFAIASLIIALTPGPSWICVLSRTLAQGRASGLVAVAGNTAGIAIHVTAVISGLSLLIQQSATAFAVLKVAGAGYLAWLGLRTLRRGIAVQLRERRPARLAMVFSEAMLVNLGNPKVALLFLAFLPQFVDPRAADAPLRIAGFGLIHMAVASLITLGLVVVAGPVGPALRSSPRLRNVWRWCAGSALLAMAGRIAAAARP